MAGPLAADQLYLFRVSLSQSVMNILYSFENVSKYRYGIIQKSNVKISEV